MHYNILTGRIIAWYDNCLLLDRVNLQRMANTVQCIIGVSLPSFSLSSQCIVSGKLEVLTRVPVELVILLSSFYFPEGTGVWKLVRPNFLHSYNNHLCHTHSQRCCPVPLPLLLAIPLLYMNNFLHFALHHNFASFCCFALIVFIIIICILFTQWALSEQGISLHPSRIQQ